MNCQLIRNFTLRVSSFLVGQSVVQTLNLLCGLLILRYLSISEYALYTASSILLGINSVGSDLGISQGLIAHGSSLKNDKVNLSRLFVSAIKFRKKLYYITVILIFIVTPLIFKGHNWPVADILLLVAIVLITGWVQQSVSLGGSILSIYHDTSGMVGAGLSSAIVRLFLTATWCKLNPTAIVALTVNMLGFVISSLQMNKRCEKYCAVKEVSATDEMIEKLREFILPLIPSSVYVLIQSQVSTAILCYFGYTYSVAALGALSRLGQIIGVFMMINSFFVFPYFSRIKCKIEYIKKGLLLIISVLVIVFFVMVSAYAVPDWWLLIIGDKYLGLKKELPLALLVSLIMLISTTLYTVCVARRVTQGQYLIVITGVIVQVLYVWLNGVKTTYDALCLNMLLACCSVIVQIYLFVKILKSWPAQVSTDNKL